MQHLLARIPETMRNTAFEQHGFTFLRILNRLSFDLVGQFPFYYRQRFILLQMCMHLWAIARRNIIFNKNFITIEMFLDFPEDQFFAYTVLNYMRISDVHATVFDRTKIDCLWYPHH